MPDNIQNATPSSVMPFALCTAFSEWREYVQLQVQYHDGTIERSQLAQTSRKTFKLGQRLTPARVAALKTFWDSHQGGVVPFVFYNSLKAPTIRPATPRRGGTPSFFAATGRKPPDCCARTFRRSNSSK